MRYLLVVLITLLCAFFVVQANECDTDECLVKQCIEAGENPDVCNDF